MAYDAADCVALFNRLAGRPATDAISDTAKYDRLAKAQDRVIAMLAAVAPYALYQKVAYGSVPTLSTVDNQVFTFGVDGDDNPVVPFGKAQIFPSLQAIPDQPWREGQDYLNEVTQIRIPNNQTWSGTLYWRGIRNPDAIDASTDPALFPVPARELIVYEAVRSFAKEGSRNPQLAADMDGEWAKAWPKWCLVWKTQFRQGGALVSGTYTGKTLALLDQS